MAVKITFQNGETQILKKADVKKDVEKGSRMIVITDGDSGDRHVFITKEVKTIEKA